MLDRKAENNKQDPSAFYILLYPHLSLTLESLLNSYGVRLYKSKFRSNATTHFFYHVFTQVQMKYSTQWKHSKTSITTPDYILSHIHLLPAYSNSWHNEA